MSSPVISVSHLKRSFKSGSGNITVLKDISLTVNRGEFVAVMGASGSGKSTLLNVLGGLLAPDSGTVTVDGMDLGSMSDASLTVYRRDRVGFIFQMFNLVGTLNVEENILLPSLAGGRKVVPAALDAMIEKVGLSHRRHAMPDTLSGGEQQRVAIARALVSGPALVLADEPTGNLDSENTRLMGDLFRDLHRAQGCAFVLVTHAPDVAMWADRVIVLKDGSIVDDRSTAEFAGPAELSSFYERTLNDAL
ncbi:MULTISPECIES: ABC transporter ATP-binding protein [unclassified Akkermansia]|uniref:ABC transporter ATP-binding protein n=1 Tax=unclassified Akkermansia TaxID=2608915 RepID=UPI000E9DE1B6|nr:MULTISPECIES: ABC transporter ATP-binding protein [unclassified Akkermansia]HBI12668.1 peptide ABC transporter ATP-binding protein [Akkermansia sp.]HBN16646.1 peptide ABC transporter ATP-binding protein [Akkermansia sp.]